MMMIMIMTIMTIMMMIMIMIMTTLSKDFLLGRPKESPAFPPDLPLKVAPIILSLKKYIKIYQQQCNVLN